MKCSTGKVVTPPGPKASEDAAPIAVVVPDDATTTHPGQSIDAVIGEELQGFVARRRAFLDRNPDEAAYLASEDDHSLWRGSRLLAVLKAAPGGQVGVHRFDRDDPAEAEETEADRDDARDAQLLAFDVSDRAIARWREAAREAAEAWRLVDHDDRRDLEKWANLAQDAANQAEARLLAAILGWRCDVGGGTGLTQAHLHRHEPRGIRCSGTLFLAVPHPDREGENGDGLHALMTLAVVPEVSIVDIEDIPDFPPAEPEPARIVPPPSALDDRPLTIGERTILAGVREFGERESMHRIFLAGEYRRDHMPDTAPAGEMDAPADTTPSGARR